MNKLLKEAFEKAAELPDEDQGRVAEFLIYEVNRVKEGAPDGDARWDELFARPESQELLERMADKALADHQAGLSKPL